MELLFTKDTSVYCPSCKGIVYIPYDIPISDRNKLFCCSLCRAMVKAKNLKNTK